MAKIVHYVGAYWEMLGVMIVAGSINMISMCVFYYMWYDQAKSVWSHSNAVFIFLTSCMHHFYSYILQKTSLKLVNWFQRYEQSKDVKNNRKQKTFSALLSSILKSIFPTSDWFCSITSHILYLKQWLQFHFDVFGKGINPHLTKPFSVTRFTILKAVTHTFNWYPSIAMGLLFLKKCSK